MRQDNKFTTVSTKLSSEAVKRIKTISENIGMSVYESGQAVYSFLIHLFDTPHGATEKEETMIREFNEVADRTLQVTDPDSDVEIEEATYYIADKTGKKSGVYGALVKRPFFDKIEVSYNHRVIIERAFCLLMPKTYRNLRYIGEALGCANVLETIMTMMIKEEDRMDMKEMQGEFEDNDRDEFGHVLTPGEKPMRKVTRTIHEDAQ